MSSLWTFLILVALLFGIGPALERIERDLHVIATAHRGQP